MVVEEIEAGQEKMVMLVNSDALTDYIYVDTNLIEIFELIFR